MVQNGGREQLPTKIPHLQYPHLGLVAYCHHKFEYTKIDVSGSFAIPTFYVIISSIEIQNLQVHK